jgi:hypothetical protein
MKITAEAVRMAGSSMMVSIGFFLDVGVIGWRDLRSR